MQRADDCLKYALLSEQTCSMENMKELPFSKKKRHGFDFDRRQPQSSCRAQVTSVPHKTQP
eukprot:3160570-Pleurochrysis_carterae.AAC.1